MSAKKERPPFHCPYCQFDISFDLIAEYFAKASEVDAPHAEFVAAWNAMAVTAGLPKIESWNAPRKRLLKVRIADEYWAEHWQEALLLIPTDPFLTGSNDRRWVANVDWFLRPGSVAKLMEKASVKRGVHARGDGMTF